MRGEGKEAAAKNCNCAACQVRRAKRVDGRFSLGGEMDATSIYRYIADFRHLSPRIKYSFAFSKIYRNIPPVYFVSLFVVRLKNNINISFLFFHFFQNILEKYFSKHEISIFNENNKRGEKYRNSFRYKLKSKSNFILSRRKESRFKSIFSG